MAVTVRLEGFNSQKTINRIVKNDRVGLFTAETTAKHMDKYVPADTLTLAQTRITRPWEIEFNQPYAHRVFVGTGFNFSKDVHPHATARWDIATEKNQGRKIASEITEFIKR